MCSAATQPTEASICLVTAVGMLTVGWAVSGLNLKTKRDEFEGIISKGKYQGKPQLL